MLKVISWIIFIVCAAGTVKYVLTGLEGPSPDAWANGWMAWPIIGLTLLPITGTMSMFAGPLREMRGLTAKEFTGAPIAMGTIVSASRTGLSINDQPQLEILFDVDTMDGQSFRGVAKAIIDITELASVVPGAILPVRYRPGSTDGKVSIAADAPQAELQAVFDHVRVAKGLVTPRQLQISEQGVSAKAVVLALAPTGELRGDRAVMDIKFRVTRADQSVFDLEQQKPIDASSLPQLQPGMVVNVRYLPHDETELVVLTQLNP